MAQLPFVVAPRINPEVIQVGNENCGILSVERKGYVTAGEKSFVSNNLEEQVTSKVLDLCRKISAEYKIDMEEAYSSIVNLLTGVDAGSVGKRIEKAYSESLSDIFQCMTEEQERRKLVQAFAIILYRIDSEFTVDALLELSPELIEALSDHYAAEETRTNANSEQVLKGAEGEEEASKLEIAEKK